MAITTLLQTKKPQLTTLLQTGMTYDVNSTTFPLQQGVPQKSVYIFEVTPAPSSTTSIAAVQYIQAAQSITLNTGTITSGDDTSFVCSTYNTVFGTGTVILDCERVPTLTIGGEATTNTEDVTVILTGLDYRGVSLTSTYTITAGLAEGTYFFPNPVAGITNIYISGAISSGTSTISFGTSNYIGLPYYLGTIGHVFLLSSSVAFDNTGTLYTTAEITDCVTTGNNWRTTAPSSTTVCRGYVDCTTLDLAFTGNNYLTVGYYVRTNDSELNNLLQNSVFSSTTTSSNVNLSAYALLGASQTASADQYAYPYILSPDLTGLQYNSNSTTSTASTSTTSPDSIFYTKYASFVANN